MTKNFSLTRNCDAQNTEEPDHELKGEARVVGPPQLGKKKQRCVLAENSYMQISAAQCSYANTVRRSHQRVI